MRINFEGIIEVRKEDLVDTLETFVYEKDFDPDYWSDYDAQRIIDIGEWIKIKIEEKKQRSE